MDIFRIAQTKRSYMENQVLWNAGWERDLKKAYNKLHEQLPNLHTIFTDRMKYMTEEFKLTTMADIRRTQDDQIQCQSEFRAEALLSLATQDLAEGWSSLTTQSRRQHALEGLYKVSMAGTGIESHRSWCPDMTVAGLADDPQSFLDLLDVLVNGDDGVLTYFPNPLFDKLLKRTAEIEANAEDPELSVTLSVKLERTVFISTVLGRIYYSFYGRDVAYRFDREYKREKTKNAKPAESATPQEKIVYKSVMKDLKKIKNAVIGESQCWCCGIDENQLPPGTTLQACAKCRKINRKILYCSKECQKNDWQNGVSWFLPHKDVCGNPARQLSEPRPSRLPKTKAFGYMSPSEVMKEIPMSDWLQVEQSLVTTPGRFRSSAALLHQKRLSKRPNAPDYMLLKDPIEMGVRIPVELPVKAEFTEAKRRAMEHGDVIAVGRMYQILKPFVQRCAPVEYDLAKQLMAEYGVDLPQCRGRNFSMQDHVNHLERN